MPTGFMPTGAVTFLFTDIEASTTLWEQHPQGMSAAVALHDRLLRQAIQANGGYVFKTVGDAFCAAFSRPLDALLAALAAQRALLAEDWGEVGDLRVRMALHTGMAEERDGDYFGPTLNRLARLLSSGHGGQTLLSLTAQGLVRDHLPAGVELRDLGEHRLKDLYLPEHTFQLVAPGLPSEFPPLKTLDARPNNLPIERTLLIGREKELADVQKLLLRPDVPLLTLTGAGGSGKTRLGLQVAAEVVDHFHDGVFFVNLAPLTDPNLVLPTIAQTLGAKETPGQPLIETLKNYLQAKEMLLVLDNFEQVVEAAPQVNLLPAACPKLKVLVTSRVPLRVRGEYEYTVPPLQLPNPRQLPPLEKLAQYEAVRLFIERAQAIKADFEVNNDNAPAVAEICVRLDGLPLAIELAAARVRLLPPQAMLGRLESRLKLLTGGARDLPARQQTLRSTIAWSYDLLDEGEKQLFSRLAVFVGGCTLEAIEAVCNAEGDLQVDVLEGVESLVSKGLLQQQDGVEGEPRFGMLETIREFALERLEESEEADVLHRRHAGYYMALAEKAEPELRGPEQDRWLKRLEGEYGNLRAGLRWAEESREAITGLRLAGALRLFWEMGGYWRDGREQTVALLTLEEAAEPKAVRAKSLVVAGRLACYQCDYDAAHSFFEEGLAIARELGDKQGIANSLSGLGSEASGRGDYVWARSLLKESLAIQRELGDKWSIARLLLLLGVLARWHDEYDTARSLLEESLSLSREIGDRRNIADALTELGNATRSQGDYAAAHSLIEEGLGIYREIGDQGRAAESLLHLARMAFDQGDYASAGALLEEGLKTWRQLGDKDSIAKALGGLGHIASIEGDYVRARSLFEESLAIHREVGHRWGVAELLHALGHLAYQEGDFEHASGLLKESLILRGELGNANKFGIGMCLAGLAGVAGALRGSVRAARLIGAAEAVIEFSGVALNLANRRETEHIATVVRAQLDEEAFAKAWAEGRAMSMEEAIAYALEPLSEPQQAAPAEPPTPVVSIEAQREQGGKQ